MAQTQSNNINTNTNILTKVKDYIIKTCNISEEEYLLNIRKYLKLVLRDIRTYNSRVRSLRVKRAKLRQDIEDLEASMVGGEFRTPSEEGRNTGGKKNPPDFKMIQKLQLKEELGKLVNESLLLEKSLKDNNELMLEFIHLLKNKNKQAILELTYFESMTNGQVAHALFYTTTYVDVFKNRAIKSLVTLLESIENQSKN